MVEGSILNRRFECPLRTEILETEYYCSLLAAPIIRGRALRRDDIFSARIGKRRRDASCRDQHNSSVQVAELGEGFEGGELFAPNVLDSTGTTSLRCCSSTCTSLGQATSYQMTGKVAHSTRASLPSHSGKCVFRGMSTRSKMYGTLFDPRLSAWITFSLSAVRYLREKVGSCSKQRSCSMATYFARPRMFQISQSSSSTDLHIKSHSSGIMRDHHDSLQSSRAEPRS